MTTAVDDAVEVGEIELAVGSTFIPREIYTHVTPPMQSDAAERVAAQTFRSESESAAGT